MESRTLQITLESGSDLNDVGLITKMDVYAVVSISGGDRSSKQEQKTPVGHNGDANPTWNYPMNFTVKQTALLKMNSLTLEFKLYCEQALVHKDVGEVSVPIQELLGYHEKRSHNYKVRKPSGNVEGQLRFSSKCEPPPQRPSPPVPGFDAQKAIKKGWEVGKNLAVDGLAAFESWRKKTSEPQLALEAAKRPAVWFERPAEPSQHSSTSKNPQTTSFYRTLSTATIDLTKTILNSNPDIGETSSGPTSSQPGHKNASKPKPK